MSWFTLGAVRTDGLTAAEVLHNIPHDAAAFFVYALVAIFVGLMWLGSRQKE